jgi:hypothetical protein
MSARKISTATQETPTGVLATVTATERTAPGPDALDLNGTEVFIYWHTPVDGSASYLVVEIDGDSPVRIVRHDMTVFEDGL